MNKLDLSIKFDRGYIAHPYWIQREKVINITKQSGINRARTQANRVKALTEHLTNIGMTTDEYEELVRQADREFYTVADLDKLFFGEYDTTGHLPDEFVIPPNQIMGCLTQAADMARAANRIVKKEQVRSTFVVDPIYTGKTIADGVWERFAVVTGGGGAKLSNQRALRRNQFIREFEGLLRIRFPKDIDPQRVQDFVKFAGRDAGIGSSRKLGWGRFTVE